MGTPCLFQLGSCVMLPVLWELQLTKTLPRGAWSFYLFSVSKSFHVILAHPALPEGMTRGEYQHLDWLLLVAAAVFNFAFQFTFPNLSFPDRIFPLVPSTEETKMCVSSNLPSIIKIQKDVCWCIQRERKLIATSQWSFSVLNVNCFKHSGVFRDL